ncbi:hypothetical protein [Maribacter sp. R77961]|uniref:hypothetical protein n=1 Tax=Maribacter sp. R77961 TaxID=3093871 RepID=UPI0037C53FDA
MAKQKMTKEDFETYLYLMEKIFPIDASKKSILKTKKLIEDYYVTVLDGESNNFRKTIDRNLKYIEAIRNSTVEKAYNPDVESLKVFVSYHIDQEDGTISFRDFGEKYRKDIKAYILKNPPKDAIVEMVFPKLPEKLLGIEKRISKIEQFIDANDGFIENLLSTQHNVKSIKTQYSNEKLSLDFLNFLQRELLETMKQYKRAKVLYKNLGSFGLFIIPVKYALFDDQIILGSFFDEDLLMDDEVLDDLL